MHKKTLCLFNISPNSGYGNSTSVFLRITQSSIVFRRTNLTQILITASLSGSLLFAAEQAHSATIISGTVAIDNAGALGSGDITFAGGELLATQSLTLSPSSISSGNGTTSTFSAVTGATLTLASPDLSFGNGNLVFGSAGNAGTVEIAPTYGGLRAVYPATLTVNNGTLRSKLDTLVPSLEYYFSATTVSAGATLDFNDYYFPTQSIGNLQGAGIVSTGSLTTTDIGIRAGNFSGSIQGAGKISKRGAGSETLILSGTNTYSGGTTIFGGTLQIGDGGTTGSISGNVLNNSSLVFNRSNTMTFGDVISGTGRVTQAGSGKTILTGTNTYTGGTTISAGTLQIGDGGTSGSIAGNVTNGIAGNVTNNGNLAFNRSDALSFVGVISGTGMVIQQGTGTLTLTRVNTYSGGTTIDNGTLSVSSNANLGNSSGALFFNGGTLQTTASFTVSRATTLDAGGGTFAVNAGTTLTHSGQISGSGTLTKTGTGALTLTGANNYTGATTISTGVLSISGTAGAIAGDIVNQATLNFSRSNAYTYTGDVSGSGVVIQNGAGKTTIAGDLTHTGGTTVSAGTLQIGNGGTAGSISGDITNNSSLIFNRSNAFTFGGAISGAGVMQQNGTGNLNLTGTNTYNGATTVNSGILSVNGSIANSATTINTGGTLGGSGTVGNVTINGGRLAPGNSIGTLNVAGNVDFSAGGTYVVEVDGAGNADKINATGTATLTNGVVSVIPKAGKYQVSTDYTILTAAGGLGGTTFNTVSSTLAFLTPALSYDANNVFLNLSRNASYYGSVAVTDNQASVAKALDKIATVGNVAMDDLFDNLNFLTADGANRAYDSLSGVQHTHGNLITLQAINQFKGLLFDRINGNNQFMANNGQIMLAYNDTGSMADAGNQLLDVGTVSPQRGWWLRGTGNFGDIENTRNASGASYKAGGIAAGLDFDLNDNATAGAAVGYTRTDADVASGGLDVDSYQAALYGRLNLADDYYLSGMAGLGYHDMQSNRQVSVGLLNTSAQADYHAWAGNLAIEAGRAFTLSADTDASTRITPFAGLEYAYINRDRFTEKDGGVANLRVNQDTQDSLRSSMGARITHIWSTKGYRVTPMAELAWVHEYMETAAGIRAGFATAPATTFSVDGPDLDRDRARLALGLDVQLNAAAHLNLGYQGEFASSDERHDVAVTFRMAL